MSHVPHELAEEFPEHANKIHKLKECNEHFHHLMEKYHEVNRHIHRVETRVEAASEDFEHQLRRQRVALKDEIAQILHD